MSLTEQLHYKIALHSLVWTGRPSIILGKFSSGNTEIICRQYVLRFSLTAVKWKY